MVLGIFIVVRLCILGSSTTMVRAGVGVVTLCIDKEIMFGILGFLHYLMLVDMELLQIIMNLSHEDVHKKLDKALKRNLDTQIVKPEVKNPEPIATE